MKELSVSFPLGALQVIRGDMLPASLPARPGIYAWYWSPIMSTADIKSAEANPGEGALYELLKASVLEPYQLPPYKVKLAAPLRPEYRGTLEHRPPRLEPVAALLGTPGAASDGIRALNHMLRGPFAPFFAAPVYVGLAGLQGLKARIVQHLEKIRAMRDIPPVELRALRDSLRRSQEIDRPHMLALEIASREIPLGELTLVALEITAESVGDPDSVVAAMESLINRLVYPSFGRR